MSQLYIDATQSRGNDGSCDANCEKNYALMNRKACGLAASGYCYSYDAQVFSKYGIVGNGSSSSPPPVPPSEPFPWNVILGSPAIAAIAAVAVAKTIGKKKPEDKKKKDEDQAHYILQISPTDTIKVNTKEQGSFTATAWKMDKNGVVSRANNASITIVPPSGVPGLSIVPISGMGSVNVSVSINQPTNVNNAKVQVNASMGGGGTTAFVSVNFEVTMQVGFE